MNYLFGITDTGKVRDSNEDVFIAEELMNGQFIIAGVIDGVGGYEGGEVAAALTKEVLLVEMAAIGSDVITQLEIAFNLANEEIYARKLENTQLSSMACVATIAVIDRLNNLLHYIHVGDTRLYLFRDNTLIKISNDQSPVGFLEDSGRITEEAAMQHPKRNVINQALGLESQDGSSGNYFETGSSPFLPGDLILVCSDGLTDMINRELITRVLEGDGSLQAKAEELIAEANAAGGKDNITVVLAKNDKAPVKHAVARPAADLFSQGTADTPSVAPVSEKRKAITAIPEEDQAVSGVFGKSKQYMPSSSKPHAEDVPESQNPRHHPFVTEHTGDSGYAATSSETTGTPYSDSPGTDNTLSTARTNQPLIIALSVLCALLLLSTAWLFFNSPPVNLKPAAALTQVQPITVNPQEKLISDTLAKLKSDTLILSANLFKGPVHLSRALTISRDTLVIQTKGDVVLQPDSAYKGPALILSASCKYVVIDQLVLDNFETGIVSYRNVLDLKNVKFNNCRNPLQVLFEFPDHSFVNGSVSKRAFQADSLAKK
jgi:serine/threonine protein phosphatase PrpC